MSMSDEYDYEEESGDQPQESSVIRQLRAENKRIATEATALKEQAARTAELERENAFFKADLPRDLNEARRKAILATAAEATPEGFRKAAEELGFIEPPAPTVPADELAAMERIANGGSAGTTGVDGNYEAEINAAKTPDEVFAIKAKYNRGGRLVVD